MQVVIFSIGKLLLRFDLRNRREGPRFPAGTMPSREVASRLALGTSSGHVQGVLICTEAGAKGLNLQFCDPVINYDLPWNGTFAQSRRGWTLLSAWR
jgi:hypothetical protein